MTEVLHFTHIDHLESILKAGGIHCDRYSQQHGLSTVNIAHQSLKEMRARTPVPCGAGGTLADYVPHYFAPRSPMLYSIKMGNVVGYSGGQSELIYFCSSAEAVAAAGLDFVFTDGHGVMDFTEFYDDLGELGEVDWPLMEATYWNDTQEDPDRKRRRQAEFLVYSFMPLDLTERIVVRDVARMNQVLEVVEDLGLDIKCAVETGYYF